MSSEYERGWNAARQSVSAQEAARIIEKSLTALELRIDEVEQENEKLKDQIEDLQSQLEHNKSLEGLYELLENHANRISQSPSELDHFLDFLKLNYRGVMQ